MFLFAYVYAGDFLSVCCLGKHVCSLFSAVHVWVSAYQHHVNKLFAMFRRKKPHINTMSAPSTNHSQCQANGW
uniref:Uncharacterized protein n=1 Tax=Aegilops tauschii subsp. strangulata TaxID=200361 RepID=A0A453S8G4_AEGTS